MNNRSVYRRKTSGPSDVTKGCRCPPLLREPSSKNWLAHHWKDRTTSVIVQGRSDSGRAQKNGRRKQILGELDPRKLLKDWLLR